jgi:hypothetical protein
MQKNFKLRFTLKNSCKPIFHLVTIKQTQALAPWKLYSFQHKYFAPMPLTHDYHVV